MRSLTADPSCEEMVQLEAFRRVHVQLQLNYSPSDISRAGSDEDDEETASSDNSVQLWRRARRNPAAGWHQQPIRSERRNLLANQVRALPKQPMKTSHGNEPWGVRNNRDVTSSSREAPADHAHFRAAKPSKAAVGVACAVRQPNIKTASESARGKTRFHWKISIKWDELWV